MFIQHCSLTGVKLTVLYIGINTSTPSYTYTRIHTQDMKVTHTQRHMHTCTNQSPINMVITASEKYSTKKKKKVG